MLSYVENKPIEPNMWTFSSDKRKFITIDFTCLRFWFSGLAPNRLL